MRTLFATLALVCCVAMPALAQNANTITTSMNGSDFAAASTINAGILGAGINGPAHAQVGMKVNMNKADWWDTKAKAGEEDGVYATIFQGGANADSSAFLGEVTSGGLSYAGVLEGMVSIQPPVTSGNGTRTASIDVQAGVVNLGLQMYGFTSELTQKPAKGTAIATYFDGSAWDYFARWFNGSTVQFQVDGAGDVLAHGTIQPGLVVVANLPKGCVAGQQLYATDGRKAGERAGAGSGVPVVCTAATKDGPTGWVSTFSGAAVSK